MVGWSALLIPYVSFLIGQGMGAVSVTRQLYMPPPFFFSASAEQTIAVRKIPKAVVEADCSVQEKGGALNLLGRVLPCAATWRHLNGAWGGHSGASRAIVSKSTAQASP